MPPSQSSVMRQTMLLALAAERRCHMTLFASHEQMSRLLRSGQKRSRHLPLERQKERGESSSAMSQLHADAALHRRQAQMWIR
jgi:hypothetical protein